MAVNEAATGDPAEQRRPDAGARSRHLADGRREAETTIPVAARGRVSPDRHGGELRQRGRRGRGIRASGIDRAEVFVTTKFNVKWHGVKRCRKASRSAAALGSRLRRPAADPLAEPVLGTLRRCLARHDQAARGGQGAGDRRVELQAGAHSAGNRRDGRSAARQPGAAQPAHPSCRRARISRAARHRDRTWAPLARGKDLLEDPVLGSIAQEHSKSVAQVILRWQVQQGSYRFPKSSDPGAWPRTSTCSTSR